MAWNTKYYTEFRNDEAELFRLNLEEEDYAGGITELQSGAEPIEIISAEGDYLTPVIGSGLTMNLISADPLQLIDLNTVGKFDIRVSLLKDSVIIWQGWLNPEEYQEVYSEYKNYEISLSANDGIALLKDIKFQNADESRVTGVNNALYTLMFILGKIDTADSYVNIADNFKVYDKNDTEITHLSAETYLNSVQLNMDNYIDEKNEAMSCRDVLDGLLLSLGLLIRNNVISLNSSTNIPTGFTVYDSNVIMSSEAITFKSYDIYGTFVNSWILGVSDYTYDLETDLNYTDTGSSMSYDKTVYKQEVVFSNYQLVDILDANVDVDNLTLSGEVSRPISACSDDEFEWSEAIYSGSENFTMDTAEPYVAQLIEGAGNYKSYSGSYYVAVKRFAPTYAYNDIFHTSIPTAYFFKAIGQIVSDYSRVGLLINFSTLVSLNACLPDDDGDPEAVNYSNYNLGVKLTIGSYSEQKLLTIGKEGEILSSGNYYEVETDWTDTTDSRKGYIWKLDKIVGNTIDPGEVSITITDYDGPDMGSTWNTHSRLRFKDFTAKLVNIESRTPFVYNDYTTNTEVVVTGTINVQSTNLGSSIELIHGTGTTGGIERGQFMYENPSYPGAYFNLDSIAKTGGAVRMTPENWMLSKVFTNKETPAIILSDISIKASDTEQSVIARITDTNQFLLKIFMISGYVYKPYSNEIIYSLQEINKDNYTN